MSALSSDNYFVDIPFTTDEHTLADQAVQVWEANYPGYTAEPGDPEVVLIESCAPLAAAAAQQASLMPMQALIAFGQKILGIPWSAGVAASATVTFTAIDPSGYVIPAGAEVDIDGWAFDLPTPLTIPTNSTSASAVVYCTELTAAANGLIGSVVAPVNMPTFITTMAVTGGPTANGLDPQDPVDYANFVSLELRLRALTLVSAQDFVLAALTIPGVARAAAIGNTARQVTLSGVDANGAVLSSAVKSQLTTLFNTNRLVNTTFSLVDPTFTAVSVTYSVKAQPSVDLTDLISRCNQALTGYLNASNYGMPNTSDPTAVPGNWVNTPVLYPNIVVGLLNAVYGVRYVESVTLSAPGVTAASDGSLALPGTFPLATSGTMTGTADPS